MTAIGNTFRVAESRFRLLFECPYQRIVRAGDGRQRVLTVTVLFEANDILDMGQEMLVTQRLVQSNRVGRLATALSSHSATLLGDV